MSIGIESTAPRIKSAFKPEHNDLVQAQKRKRWRKERRIKRIATVIIGYAVMAWMVYLILVTARTVPKIWDPYDVLGISRVSDDRSLEDAYGRFKNMATNLSSVSPSECR